MAVWRGYERIWFESGEDVLFAGLNPLPTVRQQTSLRGPAPYVSYMHKEMATESRRSPQLPAVKPMLPNPHSVIQGGQAWVLEPALRHAIAAHRSQRIQRDLQPTQCHRFRFRGCGHPRHRQHLWGRMSYAIRRPRDTVIYHLLDKHRARVHQKGGFHTCRSCRSQHCTWSPAAVSK